MLVIFDWDGTLVDSAAKIVRCLAAASADCGVPILSFDEYKHIIGLGLPEAFAALYPEASPALRERLRLAYVDHFIDDNSPTTLFAGVESGLDALQAQGYRLAVATGKSRRGMNRVLEELAMHDRFEITRCADETRSKPHPLMLEEILEHSKLAREQAVMVGDTSFDLAMAANAQMRAIAVSYGAHSQSTLLAHQPIAMAHGFDDVVAAVAAAFAP